MNSKNYNLDANNTHINKIKEYLLSGKDLTKQDALKLFGCWNTGDVVFKLRKQGLPIHTEMVEQGKKRYAVYRLKREAKQLLLF